MFGLVRRIKPDTPPDNLVLQVLGMKGAFGPALDYGRSTEDLAHEQYVKYQKSNGHRDLFVSPSGLHIHPSYHFLGASPLVSLKSNALLSTKM